jgi:hypothetical protein
MIVVAMMAGQLVMPAYAKPNVITIIVKVTRNTPLTYSETIQVFDPDLPGEPNALFWGSTDNDGKLVLANGVPPFKSELVPKKTYIVAHADFGTLGTFRVNGAGGAHVTVYLKDSPYYPGP